MKTKLRMSPLSPLTAVLTTALLLGATAAVAQPAGAVTPETAGAAILPPGLPPRAATR